MTTQQPKSRLEKLRSMRDQGLADKGELSELAELEKAAGTTPASTPSGDGAWETIEGVNADKFGQGWGRGFTPPPQDAIYLGMWTDVLRSKGDPDSITLVFESLPGDPVQWRGGFFCDKLSASDGRAGKLKDAFDAMDVQYRVVNGAIQHQKPNGQHAKLDFQTVTKRDKTKERRIQNVLPLKDKSEVA